MSAVLRRRTCRAPADWSRLNARGTDVEVYHTRSPGAENPPIMAGVSSWWLIDIYIYIYKCVYYVSVTPLAYISIQFVCLRRRIATNYHHRARWWSAWQSMRAAAPLSALLLLSLATRIELFRVFCKQSYHVYVCVSQESLLHVFARELTANFENN